MTDLMRRLTGFARDFLGMDRAASALALILVALGAILEGASLVLLVPIIMVVTGAGGGGSFVSEAALRMLGPLWPAEPLDRLLLLLGLFGLVMIARSIILLLRDVRLARLQIGFVSKLRLGVLQRLAHAGWGTVTRLRHGRITHLMSGDIQSCAVAGQGLIQMLVGGVMLIAHSIVAFLLSPALAALTLLLLAVSALIFVPLLARSRNAGAGVTHSHLKMSNNLIQLLGGLKLTYSQNLQGAFLGEIERQQKELSSHHIAFMRQQSLSRIAFTGLAALIAGGAVLAGFGLMGMEAPVLLAMLVVLSRISGPAIQIQQSAQLLVHSLPAYGKVKELERELEGDEATGARAEGGDRLPSGPIVFDKVSFLHGSSAGERRRGGVRDLDLSIEPGSFVGVAGPSGAGKTTLADLLVGLFEPQAGALLVGGIRLGPEKLSSWRRGIGYVSQDPFLLHDSIRRNLLWGAPDATEAEIGEALRLAGADEVVDRLEDGLDTIVGERGSLVSGGERQRLALARALLRNPDLLILDEATNAVDEGSERAIYSRLAALAPRPTIVVVSHRMANLDLCDRVLIIREGKLASDSRGGTQEKGSTVSLATG